MTDSRIRGDGVMSSKEALDKTRAHFEEMGLDVYALSDEDDQKFWLMYDRNRWGDPDPRETTA